MLGMEIGAMRVAGKNSEGDELFLAYLGVSYSSKSSNWTGAPLGKRNILLYL